LADVTYVREDSKITLAALEAAANAFELRQLMDGRPGWMQGANAAAAGDQRDFRPNAIVNIPKTAGIALLAGGKVFFDRSARTATFKPNNDRDYYVGTAYRDAAAEDAAVSVILGAKQERIIDLNFPDWITENTDGLGVTNLFGNAAKLAFDAVAEVAQAAIVSERTIPPNANPIVEIRFKVVDGGDDAALDVDIGIASGTHATDFEAIAEFVAFHLDGNSVNISAHSDDGATDVPVTDTTVDYALGTTLEGWIDARDRDNVKLYVEGVRVLASTTFQLTASSGPLKAIVLMEKSNDDTPAEIRVLELGVRISEQ
jgi:predicted RecA/RadA family phage recombinase